MNASLLVDVLVYLLQGLEIVLGGFLAMQAYRGYSRHGAKQMEYLAIGFLFLTVIPGLLTLVSPAISPLSDAVLLLSLAVVYLIGLAGVDYSLNYISEE